MEVSHIIIEVGLGALLLSIVFFTVKALLRRVRRESSIERCVHCKTVMKDGKCPNGCETHEVCPTCGMELVDGECPNGVHIIRCVYCGALLKDGLCPNGCKEPEFCPTCNSELVDGECPRGHTIVRCSDCGSILSEGVCPKSCNANPLNLGWPGGAERKLGAYALEVVTCPNSEGEGFTLRIPDSFVMGRSSTDAKEPFVELLTITRKEKAMCSRQYVRMNLDLANGGFVVTLLNSSRNPAFVDGKKIVMQGDTATLPLGGRIKINPGYELELVRVDAEGCEMPNSLPTGFLDTPEVSSLLFHPRRCDAANKLAPTSVAVPGSELGGLWFDNPGSDDVVLFFHGNGEVAADWISMASDYAAAFDASVWFIDYRGYGRSSGEPSYGNMLMDAEAAFAALSDRETERGRPFRRRYVFGRSIGSAPAIHLAWRFSDQVAALVIDSGFSRVTELVGRFREMRGLSGGAPSAPDGFFDNVDKLRSCRMPTLLIHGVVDKLIPVSEARENFEASAASEKQLVEIPGAGHNNLLFKSRMDGSYFGAVRNLRNAI